MGFTSALLPGSILSIKNNIPSTHYSIRHLCAGLSTQKVYWRRCNKEERCALLSFRRPIKDQILHAVTVDDTTSCKLALTYLREKKVVVYSGGDYRNACQLLQAVKKRYKRNKYYMNDDISKPTKEQWMDKRKGQQEKSEVVNRILIQIGLCINKRPYKILDMKRAPSNAEKVLAFGFQNDERICSTSDCIPDSTNQDFVLLSLNDYLAMVGAFEWNRKGVYIHSLRNYIYPHFGVFPPTRQDYITLVENIKTDTKKQRSIRMLEVGIGTGVLSQILLRQNKVHYVVGTDINPYAIACSRDNFQRCALINKVHLIQTDLFPTEQNMLYDVILFNPPWLPGDAMTQLDKAVYDTSDQSILRDFLINVHKYIQADGQVYLVISNLGMLLGLFQEQNLHQMFDKGGLKVIAVYKTTCKEEIRNESTSKMTTPSNIEDARAKEVIFLYHLRVRQPQEHTT